MKREPLKIWRLVSAVTAPIAGCAGLYTVWAATSWWLDNPILLPPPNSVLVALVSILQDELAGDILASLYHLGIGMSFGMTIGFSLAVLATQSRFVEHAADPLIELLRPISGIAWIPLAILMFGVGETVPIFLIAYVSVFPIYINTVAGIAGVDRRLINAAKVLGAPPSTIRRQVILPSALPMILAGFRLSLGVAWMTLIGAELIGGESGLGWRAFWYEQFFAMNKTLAVIIVVGILGFLFDSIVRLVQARLLRWSPNRVEAAA